MKYIYEIRQIDAVNTVGYWEWNTSYYINRFTTRAKNHKRAFLNALKNEGIFFKRGAVYVHEDFDVIEVRLRRDDMPLFAAIPVD